MKYAMTVAELIDYLGAFDPDQQVVMSPGEAPEDRPESVVVLAFAFDESGPDEWFAEDYTQAGGSARVRERVQTSQTPTVLHDHARGEACGDCESWNTDECDTCGGSGRWETTHEDAPTTLVGLGPCPECTLMAQPKDDPIFQRLAAHAADLADAVSTDSSDIDVVALDLLGAVDELLSERKKETR